MTQKPRPSQLNATSRLASHSSAQADGGPHPYGVHELLALEDPDWPLGYELV
jgi:hypothetical protein